MLRKSFGHNCQCFKCKKGVQIQLIYRNQGSITACFLSLQSCVVNCRKDYEFYFVWITFMVVFVDIIQGRILFHSLKTFWHREFPIVFFPILWTNTDLKTMTLINKRDLTSEMLCATLQNQILLGFGNKKNKDWLSDMSMRLWPF